MFRMLIMLVGWCFVSAQPLSAYAQAGVESVYRDNGEYQLNPRINPERRRGEDKFWNCDGLMSPEFRELIYSEVRATADALKLPSPNRGLCEYSHEKLFPSGLPIINITHYHSLNEKRECNFGGMCRNVYTMTILPRGPMRSYTLIGPDAKSVYGLCVQWNGNVTNYRGNCFSR